MSSDIQSLRGRYPARPEEQLVSRIAPSPTGFFHLGGLLAAFVPYLYMKQNDGVFFFRIEDTDQERKQKALTVATTDHISSLRDWSSIV